MSARTIWVRPLAGATRAGVSYYWSTGAGPVPAWASGMVALPLSQAPSIPAASIEALGTLAADAVVSWAGPATAEAIAVAAPDLGLTSVSRRVGLLAAYVEAADDTIEVTGWTGASGQLIQIGREVMTAGALSGTTLAVTRTVRQDHATSLARPTPVMRADRVPLTGQFVEVGVTEAGGDTVYWRGVCEAPSVAGQTMRCSARPLTALARNWRGRPPASVPYLSGRRAIYAAGPGTLMWARDPGEYPGQWPLIRVVGSSGDWALLSPDYMPRTRWLMPPYVDDVIRVATSDVLCIGTGDGVVRITATGETVTVRGAGGTTIRREVTGEEQAESIAREHLAEVLGDLSHVELASVETSLLAWDLVLPLLAGAGLPSGWSLGLPSAWVETTYSATRAMYEPVGWPTTIPRLAVDGTLAEWLSASVLAASGWYLTQDMGVLLVESWEETTRDALGIELSDAAADDRGAWAWAGAATAPMSAIVIEDPSLSVEEQGRYVLGMDSLRIRPRVGGTSRVRTETTAARVLLAADPWLDGGDTTLTISARLGVSATQIATLEALLSTYSAQIPTLTIAARDVGRAVGRSVVVELSDAPTSERHTGFVTQVSRDLAAGTMTVTVLLPGVGRELATFWAPGLELSAVSAGTATVTGDLGARYPATLDVYRPDGTRRGQITGAALTVATLTWTGGVTPEDGDVATLPPRPPVVALPGAAGVYGYIAEVTPVEGDATWQ